MEIIGILRQVDLDNRTGRVRYCGSDSSMDVLFESSVTEAEIISAIRDNQNLRFCGTGVYLSKHTSVNLLMCKSIREICRAAHGTPLDRLSVRVRNCLEIAGISTYEQLMELTADQVVNISGIGNCSWLEIRDQMAQRGLFFADPA